jgi:very-short-patch-repair endonuclease
MRNLPAGAAGGEGDRPRAIGDGGGASHVQATGKSMASARQMRRKLSLPEMLLWQLLRLTRRELRFRKQHAIGPYVADFYCPVARMVIEIDGATHDTRQDADGRRDAYMESLGLRVVRIAAADVLADPEGVADGIYRLCEMSAGPSTTQPGG